MGPGYHTEIKEGAARRGSERRGSLSEAGAAAENREDLSEHPGEIGEQRDVDLDPRRRSGVEGAPRPAAPPCLLIDLEGWCPRG
jgi:hypothetical protein